MAAADEQLIFAGGRLILTPTDLGTAPNYGGTQLGTVQDVALTCVTRTAPIVAEEYGGEVVDEIYMGEEWVCTAILRNFDPDAITAIFPNTSAGTVDHPGPGGNHPTITYPGSTIAIGDLYSGKEQIILYAPDDVSNHPGFLLYAAIPRPDPEPIRFGHYDDLAVMVTWLCIRDSSSRTLRIAPIADQTL